MITLFKPNETNFDHNGLGSLDKNILETVVEEELNGLYSFVFKYPIFAPHGSEIDGQSVIRVPTPDGNQLFRVYNPIKSMGYVTIKTYHIFYDLADNFVEDTNIVGKNGQGAITQLGGATQYSHTFRFFSDIETTINARIVRMNPVAALIDDEEDNTFISRWGGELKRNNFDVRMNKSIGTNRGKRIQHRKDLIGYEANVNWATAVTRIMPKGFNGLLLPGKYVDSPLINRYIKPKIKVIEYSDIKAAVGEYANDKDAVPLQTAYQLLRERANEEYSVKKVDIPEATYKVDFVSLDQTEEYKDLQELQKVFLGDTVTVEHKEDGLNIEAKVISYKYNPLAKKYLGLELGSFKETFTSKYSDITKLTRKVTELVQTTNFIQSTADGKNTINRGTSEPLYPNINDLWYKPNGSETELWQYVDENVVIYWKMISSTAELNAVKKEVDEVIDQADLDRTKAEQDIETAKQTAKEYTDAQVIAFDTKFEAETGAIRNEVTASYNNAITAGKSYTDNKSAEFNTQLDLAKADVTNTVIKADDAVTKANKAITDAGFMRIDLDATKVTAIDALTKAQTATDNVNSLTTSYDALTKTVGLKAERAQVNAISGVVDQHELKISANAQAITARLTSAQVDNLITGKGYVNQSQLTATSSQWNLVLTQVSSELSNLAVGGTNLLPNSSFRNQASFDSFFAADLTKTLVNGEYTLVNRTSTASTRATLSKSMDLSDNFVVGDSVTVSIDIYVESLAIDGTTVFVRFPNTSGGFQDNGLVQINTNVIKNKWIRVYGTTTIAANTDFTKNVTATFAIQGTGRIRLRNMQIERGNIASDWSPSFSDMATLEQFTTLDVKVNGIQTTVGNKADQSQVTQLANQWTQTTALANGHTGQISNLGEQINLRVVQGDVTAAILADKKIKDTRSRNDIPLFYIENYPNQEVREFKTRTVVGVPGNSTYVQLTTKVPWSGSSGGYPVQIAESTDGTYQRVSSGTGGSWLAWDKVAEAGKLISQINISTEGLLLQGKRIQLDGDVTMTTAFVTRLDALTLTAVYADIATLKTKVLTADVITASNLLVDYALIDKLTARSIDVDRFFSKTAVISQVEAKALTAIYADIATLRTKFLTADLITSTYIKSDTAVITKLFATDANVNVLTAKTAFINSVKAIDIAADRITAGTLNASLVNIINLNANRISTGTIAGANSSWNLNTGIISVSNPSSGDIMILDQGQISFQNGAQGRYLRYQSEGLRLLPYASNTGTSKNTALHLIGGGSGSYQYIQFVSQETNGIDMRLEAEGQIMTAYHGKTGSLNVAKYGEGPNSGLVLSGAYETRHSTGVSLRIAGDSISTPRDGARNIYLTPQGVGSVVSGNASGVRYNMVASDFVKQSSRATKTNIIPLAEGLSLLNRLKPVSYNKIDKLNQGIVELEKGFISEDSFGVSTPDGKGVYDSHITAHLVKGVQELDQKVIAIDSLATAANSIADNAMNKAIQTDGEVQQMKNKILELEKEIKTLKGAA